MPSTDDEELEQIWSWNAQVPRTTSTYVQSLIAETAQQQPYLPAISAWDGELNYGRLISISTQIAKCIVERGTKPGVVLPICIKKSKWMPVTMLGALKADCGIALMDWNTPHARRCKIVQMLDPPFVLTTSDLESNFDSILPTMLIDKLPLDKERPDLCATVVQYSSSSVAAIVFTSGSTGSPKGVVLSHECISSTAVYGCELFQLGRTSRVFQFASYSFDISLHEILMTLVAGGCLCIPSEKDRLNNTMSAIRAFDATWICITPSAASSLLSDPHNTSLQTIVFTGEAITARICKFFNIPKVFSWYGASEVPLTSVSVLKKDSWKSSQIGSRYPGVCWIVNPGDPQALCAMSEVGELLVEGPMQASGYLDLPEMTEAAFLSDPVWLTRGSSRVAGRSGKLYKTGDLVKYNTDGTLTYISRKDTMVKIRGQRVELGEIEHRIWSLMHSDHAVVDMINQGGGESKALVSFIKICSHAKDEFDNVAELAGENLDAKIPYLVPTILSKPDQPFKDLISALDQELRRVLPEYMVPSAYLKLHSVPMTPSGKIDRGLLRSLAQQLPQKDLMACQMFPSEGDAGLRDEKEQILCELWAKILGLDEMSFNTNTSFLQCGGDSLRAITLAKALERDFNFKIDISCLIKKETTIKYLATLIDDSRRGKPRLERRIDLATELKRWLKALQDSCIIRHRQTAPLQPQQPQVLLTGATGYLGTQILNQLVSSPEVGKIVVLVRAREACHAKQRIQRAASISGWWTKSASRQIVTWIGDLSQPRLGLDQEKWDQISLIDTIIHNGAIVSWAADYHALELVNVRSTYQILQASLRSKCLRRLIYVSGGIKQEPGQSDLEYVKQLNSADGYTQTKYISEKLTKEAERLYQERGPRDSQFNQDKILSIVKPGYIIGDHITGLSNVDDFLWKVVAGAVHLRSYPEDPPDSWLDLADITRVARFIVRQCQFPARKATPEILSPPTSADGSDQNGYSTNSDLGASLNNSSAAISNPIVNAPSTYLHDDIGRGLLVSRFWAAVQTQVKIHLEPNDWSSWIDLAQQDMKVEMENHPLWGIQQFLGPSLGTAPPQPNMSRGDIQSEKKQQQQQHDRPTDIEVEAAVRRCVQYLIDIKFIQVPPNQDPSASTRKRKRGGGENLEQSDEDNGRHEFSGRAEKRKLQYYQNQQYARCIGRSKFTRL